MQCADKVELVKSIIVKLSKAVHEAVDNDRESDNTFRWTPIDVNEYFATSQTISVSFTPSSCATARISLKLTFAQQAPAPKKVDYSYLFDDAGNDAGE